MVRGRKLNISVDTEMLLMQFESILQHFKYNWECHFFKANTSLRMQTCVSFFLIRLEFSGKQSFNKRQGCTLDTDFRLYWSHFSSKVVWNKSWLQFSGRKKLILEILIMSVWGFNYNSEIICQSCNWEGVELEEEPTYQVLIIVSRPALERIKPG